MADFYRLQAGTPESYGVAQFRADYPRLSISDLPHDGELAAFAACDPPILLFRPQPTPPPPWDPATQALVEDLPILVGDQWHQAWRVEDLPPPPPAPDFAALREGIRQENGFRPAFMAAIAADFMEVAPIVSRLDDWEQQGNWRPFLESLMTALAKIGQQDAAHTAWEFLALATRCHMDQAFLEALQAELPDAG
jgi:hypothetical protein